MIKIDEKKYEVILSSLYLIENNENIKSVINFINKRLELCTIEELKLINDNYLKEGKNTEIKDYINKYYLSSKKITDEFITFINQYDEEEIEYKYSIDVLEQLNLYLGFWPKGEYTLTKEEIKIRTIIENMIKRKKINEAYINGYNDVEEYTIYNLIIKEIERILKIKYNQEKNKETKKIIEKELKEISITKSKAKCSLIIERYSLTDKLNRFISNIYKDNKKVLVK